MRAVLKDIEPLGERQEMLPAVHKAGEKLMVRDVNDSALLRKVESRD